MRLYFLASLFMRSLDSLSYPELETLYVSPEHMRYFMVILLRRAVKGAFEPQAVHAGIASADASLDANAVFHPLLNRTGMQPKDLMALASRVGVQQDWQVRPYDPHRSLETLRAMPDQLTLDRLYHRFYLDVKRVAITEHARLHASKPADDLPLHPLS